MEFKRNWTAERLVKPPLITPARSYIWPMRIAGEEEALARGAVNVMVRPESGTSFLVTAAIGFKDPAMPTGIYGCPQSDQICIAAGGYVYLANVADPETVTLLDMKPVVQVMEVEEAELLLLIGFTDILGWGPDGKAWQTRRLSWEGLQVTGVLGGSLHGSGWDLMKDAEVAFEVDLRTGEATGGGYRG